MIDFYTQMLYLNIFITMNFAFFAIINIKSFEIWQVQTLAVAAKCTTSNAFPTKIFTNFFQSGVLLL